MSKEQESILQELLKAINQNEEMGAIGFSTAKELTTLVRQLQVA